MGLGGVVGRGCYGSSNSRMVQEGVSPAVARNPKWLRFKPLRSVVIIALEVKSLPIPRVRAPPVQFAHRVLPCCYHYYYVITCVPQSVSSHVTTPHSLFPPPSHTFSVHQSECTL